MNPANSDSRGLKPEDCQHAWEPSDLSPTAPPGLEVPFNFCPYCGVRLEKPKRETYNCGGIPTRSCED